MRRPQASPLALAAIFAISTALGAPPPADRRPPRAWCGRCSDPSATNTAGPATVQVSSRIAMISRRRLETPWSSSPRCARTSPAPRSGELIAKLGGLVAGGLGARASSRPLPVSLAAAHTQARPAKVLLYLQPEIARGQLRVTADLYRVTPNVWDRVRQPVLPPGTRLRQRAHRRRGAIVPRAGAALGQPHRARVDRRPRPRRARVR